MTTNTKTHHKTKHTKQQQHHKRKPKQTKQVRHKSHSRTPKSSYNRETGGRGNVAAAVRRYVACLEAPFSLPGVKLGFGNFGPSSIRTAFHRHAYSNIAAETCNVILSTPNYTGGGGTLANNGFLTTYALALPTDVLSVGTIGRAQATNYSLLQSTIQTCRVVSMAMRVTVRYASTALRGTMLAGFIPDDSSQNLNSFTAAGLGQLALFKPVTSRAAGEISCEVQYRPFDTTCYDFTTNWPSAAMPNSISCPQLVVVLQGWPGAAGSFSVEINTVCHYEALCGLDASGDDQGGGDTLAAAGLSTDEAGTAAGRAGPAVLSNVIMIDALDSMLSTMMGRHGLRGARGALRNTIGTQNSVPIPYGASAYNASGSANISGPTLSPNIVNCTLHPPPPDVLSPSSCAASCADPAPAAAELQKKLDDALSKLSIAETQLCEFESEYSIPPQNTNDADLSQSTLIALKRIAKAAHF